jgi:ABC-type spermidine/putrescine transport system permease subunit I
MNRRQRLKGILLVLPPVAVVGVFIGLPILAAVLYTFGYIGGPNSAVSALAQGQVLGRNGGLTLGAYRSVATGGYFTQSLAATLWITMLSVVVVGIMSWGVAFWARVSRSRLAKAGSVLAVVPLFVPTIIGAYALLNFYDGTGFWKSILYLAGWHSAPALGYTNTVVIIGQVWTNLPLGVLLMASGMSAVPDSLIESARDAGASRLRAGLSILWPMCLLPTVITLTFTAISVIGSFTIPYLIGPNANSMLGVTMTQFFATYNRPQQADVMAVAVFVISAAVGATYVWANFRTARRSGGVA